MRGKSKEADVMAEKKAKELERLKELERQRELEKAKLEQEKKPGPSTAAPVDKKDKKDKKVKKDKKDKDKKKGNGNLLLAHLFLLLLSTNPFFLLFFLPFPSVLKLDRDD